MSRLLDVENVCASYGDLHVLFSFSMYVDEGEVVSLVGSNGAGKTTFLRILSGLMPITEGRITFAGQDLVRTKSYKRPELGIAHIPQGRGTLGTMTTYENLLMGAYPKNVRKSFDKNLERVYSLFPILKDRRNQVAGTLSGGQQQMLAIGRALMLEPKLLILDEPSLGLAPIMVGEVFEIIQTVAKEGISTLIVEQNLVQALSIAQRGYVLENGHLVLEGSADTLLKNPVVREAYLGI